MKTNVVTGAVLGVALLASASPSWALFGDDEARKAILDLREKTQVLQNSQLELMSQIEGLREQNANLMGRLEKVTNELAQEQRRVRDLFGNLDKRVAAFESQMSTIDGKEVMVTPEEQRRYDLALSLFSEGQYEASGALLKSLLTDYPQGGYAASARYWLGQALYVQKNYAESLQVLQQFVTNFSKDERVSEAKVSMAASYVALNQKKEAVDMLQNVVKQYPGTQAAQIAAERLKGLGVKAPAKKR